MTHPTSMQVGETWDHAVFGAVRVITVGSDHIELRNTSGEWRRACGYGSVTEMMKRFGRRLQAGNT